GRTTLWASALDYIQHHPICGAGYGNWKLASIPYEREHIDELFVAYHSHNDFLEMTAETGWLGGLTYLSLFVLSGIWLFRLLVNAQAQEKFRMVLIVALALASYFTDAMFNFPVERPVMQFFLAFVLALVLLLRLEERAQSAVSDQAALLTQGKWIYPLFLSVTLLFSGFFNAKVYQSMRAQLNINVDVLKGEPEMSFDDVNEQLPAIPNLNAFCFPIDLIKARYLIKEKRYAEAIQWLKGCRNQSPLLSINEFFTAQSYLAMGNKDSAFYWTSKAFEYRPRVRNNYVLLNQLLVERKDSLKIENSFAEVSKFRKEPWVWNTYLGSLQGVGVTDTHYRSMLDSALVLYPQDSTLMLRRNSIAAIATRDIIESASKAFMRSDYKTALSGFLQALEQNPYDYANTENVGMCYYAMQDYKNAIVYFDIVIAMSTARDAKSAYFKGVSLIALNQRSDACAALRFAARSNYPGAADLVKANCGQ
ncbi:MAG: O-antigen ligase family protein, partial [Chitinophagaceae bacterium]